MAGAIPHENSGLKNESHCRKIATGEGPTRVQYVPLGQGPEVSPELRSGRGVVDPLAQ